MRSKAIKDSKPKEVYRLSDVSHLLCASESTDDLKLICQNVDPDIKSSFLIRFCSSAAL